MAWVVSFACICQTLLSSPVFGESYTHASTHPIHIQADKMIAQPQKQYVAFKGNVQVRQDTMKLEADRLNVHMIPSKQPSSMTRESVQKINASGHVKITWKNHRVEAESAIYFAPENKLIVSGDKARLYQGQNTIAGSTITLYMDTDQIEIESKTGEQVEAVYEFSEQDLKKIQRTERE